MHFMLGNSTIRYIYDTQNLNIICIISYFDLFPFFEHYFHYNIYVSIWISLHRTAGPSHCILFKYLQYTCPSNYRYTATIHGYCLFLSHIFPTIRANNASLWSTNTKVNAIHWWFYYCYLVYRVVYCQNLTVLIFYVFCIHFALQRPKPTTYRWTLTLYIVSIITIHLPF